MSADDDRIAGRLDEDQERLLRAATPHGFELRQPRKRPLEEHKLQAFQSADTVLTRLTGEVDGALVDVFEYDWVQPAAKGAVSRGRRVLTVLRHPAFDGDARCVPDTKMSMLAKLFLYPLIAFVFVTIWWLLIPIWLWQYSQGQNPFPRNWKVGNPAFQERFKVQGPSLERAKRALPEAAQALAVVENLTRPMEVRPGVFAFGFEGKSLDAETFEQTVRLAKRVVATYAPSPAEPATAYRVATDATEQAAEAEEENEEEALNRR